MDSKTDAGWAFRSVSQEIVFTSFLSQKPVLLNYPSPQSSPIVQSRRTRPFSNDEFVILNFNKNIKLTSKTVKESDCKF